MVTIQGYYDGLNIQPMEKIHAKKNQRVTITIMDEFVEPKKKPQKDLKGALSKYANPELAKQEEGAFERAMVEKCSSALLWTELFFGIIYKS